MTDIVRERAAASTNLASVAPYLKALTLASGLLAVWVGLCAI